MCTYIYIYMFIVVCIIHNTIIIIMCDIIIKCYDYYYMPVLSWEACGRRRVATRESEEGVLAELGVQGCGASGCGV